MAKTQHDGLLEAMEQQQISIAKAGVVASLPSRCSVIAAANPKNGHYKKSKTVSENLALSSPLLSRFDLVFILQDNMNNSQDRLVSRTIMNMYCEKGEVSGTTPTHGSPRNGTFDLEERLKKVSSEQNVPLPGSFVKDYIAYARQYCHPRLTAKAGEILQEYFLQRR